MKAHAIARTGLAARQSFQINQPFAALHWPDLMTPAELKFWAGSPLGAAFLASISRAHGFTSGKAVQKSVKRQAFNFGTVTKQEYSIAGGEPMPHSPKLRTLKVNGAQLLQSTAGRGEVRRGAVVSGGSFDVPLFESRAAAVRGVQQANELRCFVDVIALQAAGRAVRVIEDKTGRKFSDTARDEALAEASSSVITGLRSLTCDWTKAQRFARPAFGHRTLVSERRRRAWLWCQSYRAAFRCLTANPVGLTGRKGFVEVTPLEGVSDVPLPDTDAIEERGRSDYRIPRRIVWQKLGCIWGIPQKIGCTFNLAESAKAVRRRWRLLLLLLRGVPASEAIRRCGFGASFTSNGQFSRLLASVGVQTTKGFAI